jgi:23S rRNA (uracil1939-C5)-methyltransferase
MSEIVEIARLGHSGDGITQDGLFLPYTVPGDVVQVVREGARGRVLDLVQGGPSRIAPVCRHFGHCGGCALQMLEHGAYLAWKRELLVNALHQRGIGGAPVEDIRAVPPGTRRRANFKARARAAGVELGFYAAQTRRLIDIVACPILVPALAGLIAPLKEHLRPVLRPGETAELFATATDSGIDLAIRLERTRDPDLLTALSEFAVRLKVARLSWKNELIVMTAQPVQRIGQFTVALPISPFLQPTREGERALQELVRKGAGAAERVADLFCGCGTFALALAEGRSVYAADDMAEYVDALATAARAGGADVVTKRRNLFARPLNVAELAGFDAVVLNPPRVGARAQAEALAQSRAPRVLYVSCNPASFARDAKVLVEGGYRLERVVPLDQFLWSPHVESFAVFAR